jgi:hypothetical protein
MLPYATGVWAEADAARRRAATRSSMCDQNSDKIGRANEKPQAGGSHIRQTDRLIRCISERESQINERHLVRTGRVCAVCLFVEVREIDGGEEEGHKDDWAA